jgi:hypothetical protein
LTLILTTKPPLQSHDIRPRKRTIILIGVMQNRTTPGPLLTSLCDAFKTSEQGKGFDYSYAGWYLRLLGLAEAGWLPIVLADYAPVVYDRIPLDDFRPEKRDCRFRLRAS